MLSGPNSNHRLETTAYKPSGNIIFELFPLWIRTNGRYSRNFPQVWSPPLGKSFQRVSKTVSQRLSSQGFALQYLWQESFWVEKDATPKVFGLRALRARSPIRSAQESVFVPGSVWGSAPGTLGAPAQKVFKKWFKVSNKTLVGHFYPKRLLGQDFPSKRKLGDFSLIGKIFPLGENFCWKSLSLSLGMDCFPRKWRVWEKGAFTPWGKIYDFPPRGKIYLKPFYLKRCLGWLFIWNCFDITFALSSLECSRPSNKLVKEFLFFLLPCLDQGIGKTTIPKIMRNLMAIDGDLSATIRGLISRSQQLIGPVFATSLRLGLRTHYLHRWNISWYNFGKFFYSAGAFSFGWASLLIVHWGAS